MDEWVNSDQGPTNTSSRSEDLLFCIKRYGVLQTLQRSLVQLLGRLFTFEICRVSSGIDEVIEMPKLPEGYRLRYVKQKEFNGNRSAELAHLDFDWAFERGDVCTAVYFHDEIISFGFDARQSTRVRDCIAFSFPEGYRYGYASYTAPSHRGKRLASAKWRSARVLRACLGIEEQSVYYVNIANLQSRSTDRDRPGKTSVLLGYSGYVKIGSRFHCFRSWGCYKIGVGFVATDERFE